MNTKLPPLPVDLNTLPDTTRLSGRPEPGPIGTSKIAEYAPKRLRPATWPAEASPEPKAPIVPPPSIANLEQVTAEVNQLLVASAQTMVTEAQNLLAQTEAWADNLSAEIKAKVAEHAALTERLQTFGKKVLEAHKHYHDNTSGEKD